MWTTFQWSGKMVVRQCVRQGNLLSRTVTDGPSNPVGYVQSWGDDNPAQHFFFDPTTSKWNQVIKSNLDILQHHLHRKHRSYNHMVPCCRRNVILPLDVLLIIYQQATALLHRIVLPISLDLRLWSLVLLAYPTVSPQGRHVNKIEPQRRMLQRRATSTLLNLDWNRHLSVLGAKALRLPKNSRASGTSPTEGYSTNKNRNSESSIISQIWIELWVP